MEHPKDHSRQKKNRIASSVFQPGVRPLKIDPATFQYIHSENFSVSLYGLGNAPPVVAFYLEGGI